MSLLARALMMWESWGVATEPLLAEMVGTSLVDT